MDHAYLTIFLLSLGLVLIIAEIFLPSGGLIGICATCCILGSLWYAWLAWGEGSPYLWWSYIALLLALIPSTIAGTFYVLPRTPFGKILFNQGPTPEEVTSFEKEHRELQVLIGKTGKTLTLHNPGGMVLVSGIRHHSVSEGIFLEMGATVEVIGVSGNRVQVRECLAGSLDDSASPPKNQDPDEENDDPTDFDMNIS